MKEGQSPRASDILMMKMPTSAKDTIMMDYTSSNNTALL